MNQHKARVSLASTMADKDEKIRTLELLVTTLRGELALASADRDAAIHALATHGDPPVIAKVKAIKKASSAKPS